MSVRVAVTRPTPLGLATAGVKAIGEADPLVLALEREGLSPLVFPLLRVEPVASADRLRDSLRASVSQVARSVHRETSGMEGKPPEADRLWLVLTSGNVVAAIRAALGSGFEEFRADLSGAGVKIAVVGRGTAEAARSVGLRVDLVPDQFRGSELARVLMEREGEDGGSLLKVLLPRSEEGSDDLPQALRDAGVRVEVITAYRMEACPDEAVRLLERVECGEVDVICFTSGSAVRVLGSVLRTSGWPQSTLSAVIGPVTAAAAQEEGFPVDIEAREASFVSLARAIANRTGTSLSSMNRPVSPEGDGTMKGQL